MKKNINESETGKNLKNLYDEILRLSEQINSVKENMEKRYPLVDSLSKIKEEIEELKKKTIVLEECKSYAEEISKNISESKQKDEKETQIRWPLRISIVVGFMFLSFSIMCVWHLFFSTAWVKANDSIPMLIAGVIVYFVMALILVYFAYQSRHVFNLKGNKNTKK